MLEITMEILGLLAAESADFTNCSVLQQVDVAVYNTQTGQVQKLYCCTALFVNLN